MPPPPLIGLNLVYLVPGHTGGPEVYARELIRRLVARDDLRLVAFVNREATEAGWAEIPARTVPVKASNRAEWVRGEQQHLPRMAAREGCDLVHSLNNTAPFWGRFKRVTTIHDLHYKIVPEAHLGLLSLGMRVLVPGAVRRSDRIISVSENTRRDLVEHLHVPAAKIDVVPNGVSPHPEVVPTAEAELRARLELGDRRVVLAAAAKRPHKNLLRLVGAMGRIDAARRPVLVLPGYRTPHEHELRARAAELGLERDVRFLDWVAEADLEGLYALADVFAFPSLYEGFGLPAVEAMARGVPVACSGRGSLAEVAGGAALLFDPTDEDAIAASIERLLDDPAEAERLRAAGRARAEAFTWERSAELTAASYRRALAA